METAVAPTMIAESNATFLIRYLEIWQPDDDDSQLLRLQTARIVEGSELREVDHVASEARIGEGVVGSAWQQKAPVIFQDGPYVEISRRLMETGVHLASIMAFPVLANDELKSVIVFGLAAAHGGVEIWTRDDRDELSISGSWYNGLEQFEFMSSYVRFPKGAGLPGGCWAGRAPKMTNDPATNANFIRSFDRDPATLQTCMAMPIGWQYTYPAAVLLFLSSADTPLAARIDLVDCSQAEPTKESPAPEIRAKSFKSSSGDDGSCEVWHQEACSQAAAAGSAVLAAIESLPGGCQQVLAIPTFASDASISNVCLLLF